MHMSGNQVSGFKNNEDKIALNYVEKTNKISIERIEGLALNFLRGL